MLAIIISRNVDNYYVQKCWQLSFPEMLAITISMLALIISRTAGNYKFQNYWQLNFPDMLAVTISRDVSSYNFQQCWQFLVFGNIGNFNVQKC